MNDPAADLGRVLAISDPDERLSALREFGQDLDAVAAAFRLARLTTIADLRAAGRTWPEIGERLGVTPQRARQITTTPTPEGDPRGR